MLARRRTMVDTAKAVVCTVLAALLAVTPLGSLAHLANAGSDFRPDLCTAAGNSGGPAAPAQPASHPDTHAHCGDCSTCGIGSAARASPGVGAILIVAVRLDAIVAPAPVASLAGGIVARPRGPPLLA